VAETVPAAERALVIGGEECLSPGSTTGEEATGDDPAEMGRDVIGEAVLEGARVFIGEPSVFRMSGQTLIRWPTL